MEAQEEVIMGSKDHTHIVKGKRTKRQRPQSPIPFSMTANYSSSSDGGVDGNNITVPSPTTSMEFQDNTTEEEEDMANCLILLAQGQSRDDETYKFTSRRYLEGTAGKTGIYVYECRTCNRTFPSFQALGGHRASHKKPKIEDKKKQLGFSLSSDEEEVQFKNSNSFSLNLSNNRANLCENSGSKITKVHECSICGTEFTSGQALGGHMRRHRSVMSGANATLSLTPFASDQTEEVKREKSVLLDLNLPAPEDDHRESKFIFGSKQQQQQQQQQQTIVFSAPALVDCHY